MKPPATPCPPLANEVEPSGGGEPVVLDITTLIRDHHRDVYRYAYRLCGKAADAEDLTQQAFLLAHQRLGQVREPGKIAGWLFTILRTCFLKSRRKRSPVNAASLELNIDNLPVESPREDHVDPELLQMALNDIDNEYKTILLLFYFEERSYKEIASQLDIPIGTVMSRLSRAKSQLRQRLLECDRSGDVASTRSPRREMCVESG